MEAHASRKKDDKVFMEKFPNNLNLSSHLNRITTKSKLMKIPWSNMSTTRPLHIHTSIETRWYLKEFNKTITSHLGCKKIKIYHLLVSIKHLQHLRGSYLSSRRSSKYKMLRLKSSWEKWLIMRRMKPNRKNQKVKLIESYSRAIDEWVKSKKRGSEETQSRRRL